MGVKIYTYFSKAFASDVRITFTDGVLSEMIIASPANIVCNTTSKISLYLQEGSFLAAAKENKATVIEVDRKVSFDMFWDKYNLKDSGRKKGEEAWSKLSKEDKIKAFDYISVMDSKLKNSAIAKPYATTYLNQKRWEQ